MPKQYNVYFYLQLISKSGFTRGTFLLITNKKGRIDPEPQKCGIFIAASEEQNENYCFHFIRAMTQHCMQLYYSFAGRQLRTITPHQFCQHFRKHNVWFNKIYLNSCETRCRIGSPLCAKRFANSNVAKLVRGCNHWPSSRLNFWKRSWDGRDVMDSNFKIE